MVIHKYIVQYGKGIIMFKDEDLILFQIGR